MIRTQVSFKPSQKQLLEEYAYRKGISVSEVLRKLVDEKLDNSNKKQNAKKVLLKIAKLGKKNDVQGPIDLAINHNKYIYNND